MLSQLVGFGAVERAIITRTEGVSVRVIRMIRQLVGFGPVERANVKFCKKCMLLIKYQCRIACESAI